MRAWSFLCTALLTSFAAPAFAATGDAPADTTPKQPTQVTSEGAAQAVPDAAVALPATVAPNPGAPAPDAGASPVTAAEAPTPDEAAEAAPLALEEEASGPLEGASAGSPIKIYGFGDIGYRQLFVPKNSPWLLFLNREPSFFVGNLNLYFDAQLAKRWRALAEFRFTYLPQGAPDTSLSTNYVKHTDSGYADYTDFSRTHSVGSIMIERATLDYSAFSWLNISAGQWLTPYGIWNVDHGSPVIIGVSLPFVIGANLLPKAQVGLLAQGSVPLTRDFELGYALGLSNGRPDQVPYEDLDKNKAITARVSLSYHGLGDVTLGGTVYTGRTTQGYNELYLVDGSPKSRLDVSAQYDEVSYASDLKWVWRDFHLQTEWILNDRRYTEHGRPPGPNGGLRPDKRNFGGYGLIGYRTPLLGIMPYVKAEYSPEPQSQSIGVADQVVLYTGGLNFRPEARVVLKAEYSYGYFPGADPKGFAGNDIKGLDMQAAWAF
ncbi:MAG: hypothetical protein ABI488_26525 [Polyangiaceae bacterium]